MNPLGRRMVQVTPPPRTAASESRMYRVIASSRSPSSAELPDSRTTRRTPASRIRSITPGMSEKPGRRNAAAAPASAGDRLSGRSRSPATASTPGGSFARAASRTRPRTVAPLAASARTSSPPTLPVAPATTTGPFVVSLFMPEAFSELSRWASSASSLRRAVAAVAAGGGC
jgi:hypothetical protein